MIHQSPEVAASIANTGRLYGVWEILYALPALLGASPEVVAILASGPQLFAALMMSFWGRLAERRSGRGLTLGAPLAMIGLLALAQFGSVASWSVAFLAVCVAEVGLNGGVPDLKGSLARDGFDPVRQQLVAMLNRFGWSALFYGLLGLSWWWLQGPWSLERAAVVIVLLLVAGPLARVWRDARSRRPSAPVHAQHVFKADAGGTIELVVLPLRPGARRPWFAVGVEGRWRVYDQPPHRPLEWSSEERRLFDLEPLGPRPIRRVLAARAAVPLAPLPGIKPRGLPVGHGAQHVGRLDRLIDEPITTTRTVGPLAALPHQLRLRLAEIEGDRSTCPDRPPRPGDRLAEDVDPAGDAGYYRLESPAFRGRVVLRAVRDRFKRGSTRPFRGPHLDTAVHETGR